MAELVDAVSHGLGVLSTLKARDATDAEWAPDADVHRRPSSCARFGREGHALMNLVLFYADCTTDFLQMFGLLSNASTATYGYAVLAVIVALPVVLSVYDVFKEDGLGFKGVVLNATYTRMLYMYMYGHLRGDSEAAARATGDIKVVESIIESIPQLMISATLILANHLDPTAVPLDVTLAYVSAGMSVASITQASAAKLMKMLGLSAWDNRAAALGAALYFAGDAVSRAAAVAMIAELAGGAALALCAAGMVIIGLLLEADCFLWVRYEGRIGLPRIIRPVAADGDIFEDNDFIEWSQIFSQLLLSLFSALPLSTGAAARHRLFVVSTAAVGAMAAWVVARGGAGSTAVYAVCFAALGLKTLAYLCSTGRATATAAAVTGSGFGVFALSSAAGTGKGSLTAAEWRDALVAKHADASKVNIGASGAHLEGFFLALPRLTHITELEVSMNKIGDEGAASLASALGTLVNLKILRLDSNGIGPAGAASLSPALGKLVNLETLDLKNNKIGPEGAGSMAAALGQLVKLETLFLDDTDIGPEGAASLSPFVGQLVNLKILNLKGNRIGPDGASDVADILSQLLNLERFYLGDNKIGAQGAASISPYLGRLVKLKELRLSSNDLGPEGAASLAPAIAELVNLNELGLYKNDFGPEGVAVLAPALGQLVGLKTLGLGGNKIGPEGAVALSAVLGNLANLAKLLLGHNDFDDAAEHSIKAAAPDGCDVTF